VSEERAARTVPGLGAALDTLGAGLAGLAVLAFAGVTVVQPNESKVLVLFER
jgi:hypothetical protein